MNNKELLNRIVIDPKEEWLFDPTNKEIVDYLKKCLNKKATIDFDAIKKKLKEKK